MYVPHFCLNHAWRSSKTRWLRREVPVWTRPTRLWTCRKGLCTWSALAPPALRPRADIVLVNQSTFPLNQPARLLRIGINLTSRFILQVIVAYIGIDTRRLQKPVVIKMSQDPVDKHHSRRHRNRRVQNIRRSRPSDVQIVIRHWNGIQGRMQKKKKRLL